MNQIAQAEPAQELTVIDRARQALAFDQTKAQLAELAQASVRIVAITNAAGREECHAAAMALTKQRTTITATGKAAREDATKFSKAVIAAENELLGIITPEETRLRKLRDDYDADRAAEKQAAIDAENKRVANIQVRIQEFKDRPSVAVGRDSSAISDIICCTELKPVDGSYAEFTPQAQVAKDEALAKLREMRIRAVDAELEAKRVAEEQAAAAEQLRRDREELERLRAEAAERQAKADAEAQAAREEADRLAKIERDRQAQVLRDQLEAEAAERRQQEEAERAEREKAAAELRAQQEADAEELRKQRAEIKRQQDELEAKRAAEQKRLDDERAALELKQQEEALERIKAQLAELELQEAQEIARATLRDAAAEAVGLLTELGEGDHITTRKLAAALARECA